MRLPCKKCQRATLKGEKNPGMHTFNILLYPHLSGHQPKEYLVFRCGSHLEYSDLAAVGQSG